MTFSLNSVISDINLFSMDIIAKALNRSFNMVERKNVLILLRVEKHLSASADVIGVVIKIFISLTVFGNTDCRLLSTRFSNKVMILSFLPTKSSLL